MDTDLTLRVATPDDAPRLLRVIREAFAARRPVDPPADAP
jgi:tRNA threonylcarbamoyladenosine biosynthesis protein TsaE